jgi:hypothetical protein
VSLQNKHLVTVITITALATPAYAAAAAPAAGPVTAPQPAPVNIPAPKPPAAPTATVVKPIVVKPIVVKPIVVKPVVVKRVKPLGTPRTPAGKRHGRPSPQRIALKHYVFAGVVVAADPLKSLALVRVLGGNRLAMPLVGRNTVFSLGSAKLIVGDTNRDGKRDVRDIRAGDFVRIAVQLPANASTATQPYAAMRFEDVGQAKPRPKAPSPAPVKPVR